MRDSNTALIASLWFTLLLSGCASTTERPAPEPANEAPAAEQPAAENDLAATLPQSRYTDRFNRVEASLARFQWMQARVQLHQLPEDLNTDDQIYAAYLDARIDYIRGEQTAALAQLDRLSLINAHPALRYRVLSFKHYMLEMQGNWLSAAQLADQILAGAPRDTEAAWKRNIWLNLERTDRSQLLAAQATAIDPHWRAWLDLALICRASGYSPASQLASWRTNNLGHAAANPLPGGLDYQMSAGSQRQTVALMLPLSGKLQAAGNAVLNGFLAAYYAHRSEGNVQNELLVLDVTAFTSASVAYNAAVAQGATLVIGPLTKDGLADVATQLQRPVPILALNHIDQVLPAEDSSALVQLSLSPEDEAISMTHLAFGTGARRALMLAPATDWGRNISDVVARQWSELGGSVIGSATYSSYDDYSSSVKSVLALPSSEQRAQELRKIFGKNIEFTPRRRHDADVVFLLSQHSAEARSIKPLLAFHYAGDLPVYGLSTVHSGIPGGRNQDLNGIYLVETPWLLGANPGLRVTLAAGDLGENYTRLHALGADAYLVQSGFSRLQSGADAVFRGNTGLLTMDPSLTIHRELSLATFDDGELKAP
ncbi:MAG: penicillin-binding protein activator [Halioglobus sp.]|nr:penicillin-binding protein activator [Halioglobus sp.]